MYNRDNERQQYEDWHRSGRERGWFDRASDEFRSWFGDEDAERRRRLDQMDRDRDRDRDDRYENSRPSWQDRNYSGVSPRGYDIDERGRFGMDMGGMRRGRANRDHWSYGGNSQDYDYGTEYGGGRGRYGYGREDEMSRYGREDYDMEQRSGLGRRFYNRERNRDFESGMGYGDQAYGRGMGVMSNQRDFDDQRSWDRPRTGFGSTRGSMFGNRNDESMYRGGEQRGSMFGGMHHGRGPRNFQRSDERVSDEVNQVLTFHPEIDATDIEVLVDKGIVTLRGKVEDRRSKRLAEDLTEEVYGVREVRNELRTEHGLFGRTDENSTQQRNNSLLSR